MSEARWPDKGTKQDGPGSQKGFVLPRLFWIAPVMFFIGLLVRQSNWELWFADLLPVAAASSAHLAPAPTLIHTRELTPTFWPSSTPTPQENLIMAAQGHELTALPPQPSPSPTREVVLSHLSFYWPPLGDINCDHECEHIANGDEWKQWVSKGLACPPHYSLGTVFVINGDHWVCVDRGEAIVVNEDGSIWLDLLVPTMPYGLAWGSIQTVEVQRP